MRKEEYILKRKLIIGIISVALIMSLSACESSSDNSESQSINSELSKKYDFYSDSVSILKDNMNITNSQADSVFETLISIGLDKKITYCFDETDYYKVWWGSTSVDVYMNDGNIKKILKGNEQLYPSDSSLVLPEDIIWKDSDNMGIVNLKLDGSHVKEAIINDYYIKVAEYIDSLDKTSLKDYNHIQFVGNVIQNDKIECMIKGNISIDYIKSADNPTFMDIENNINDLFIPEPLK